MKSDLQERAEATRARFNGARKPIVFEVTGVPKACKTTLRENQTHRSDTASKSRSTTVATPEEHILHLPVNRAEAVFRDATCVDREAAQRLIAAFDSTGQFVRREQVESDDSVVQALPVVVVRNGSGRVLCLRRRERRHDNPLHEKVVVWAGGHVRQEDNGDGNAIRQCAVRELQEELRLSVEEQDLELLGAVWIRANDLKCGSVKTRRHVAVVFQWRAQTADVAVALSATEFFERRGTSLSGTFVAVEDLAADIDAGRLSEPWSVEIARRLLTEVSEHQAHPLLL